MADVISESGMDFIISNTFYIEKSLLYTNLGEGVRSVEFVRVIRDNLLFIEAKTTFPNPDNPGQENYIQFQNETVEICEKFIHSLNLFSTVMIGTSKETFPDDFTLPEKVILIFVLVIKNKLYSSLSSYLKKIWEPTVYVINQDTAAKRNLIIN